MMRQLAKCECVRWPNCLRPDTLDFEFTKKSVNKESNQSSLLSYIAIAVLFLAIGYFVKF